MYDIAGVQYGIRFMSRWQKKWDDDDDDGGNGMETARVSNGNNHNYNCNFLWH